MVDAQKKAPVNRGKPAREEKIFARLEEEA
jgi:hypothetical protein